MSNNFLKERRRLLKALGILGIGALSWPLSRYFLTERLPKQSATTLHGTLPQQAHRLLTQDFPSPSEQYSSQVVIIGSGIAGLAAARHLRQNNLTDMVILEQEAMIGGNASWGQNQVSSYPWAAHYLPILGDSSDFLVDFLKEANVIVGFNEQGYPIYNELYLCHDLKERLYLNGVWQEGLIPHHGIDAKELKEIDRFFSLMEKYKYHKGEDNRYAFCIPIALSSQDKQFLALDNLSMAEFLERQGFHSPYLTWYVNYCCRDDYGAPLDKVSAWAGIHYFASRRSHSANSEPDAVLVWPQGNGFLTEHLAQPLLPSIKTQTLVYEISPHEQDFLVSYFDFKANQSFQIRAKSVIMAIPRFVAQKICPPTFQACFAGTESFQYSPWLISNILLNEQAQTLLGSNLAWDNVSFYARSVGYVDAQHQLLGTRSKKRVITHYLPLDNDLPSTVRHILLQENVQTLEKMIIDDLEIMHPGLAKYIEKMDLRILAHAMIRPTPGMIWGQPRRSLKRSQEGLFFAHSDMSGISIFEEAFWQGITTAREVIDFLKAMQSANSTNY